MTDRHLDAKAWEVRALLDGRKTMTRRLAWDMSINEGGAIYDAAGGQMDYVEPHEVRRPSLWQRVQPGDRLWVREAWANTRGDDSLPTYYRADDRIEDIRRRWTPSIHMPRWASRLTLVVTAKKIERLQDISEADARAEGMVEIERPRFRMNGFGPPGTLQEDAYAASAREAFSALWDKINGEDAWANNPEVVALTFRVIHANIDSAEARAA